MIEKTITISYKVYSSINELPEEDRELALNAIRATDNAYAPYSNFKVGAAVRMSNGRIFCGNNQENAAYPSGMCAERVAIYYAQSLLPKLSIKAIAVVAKKDGSVTNSVTYPCAACRQVMLEAQQRCGKPIKVIMIGDCKIEVVDSIDALIPFSFNNLLVD